MSPQEKTRYIIAGSLIDGSGLKLRRKSYLAVDGSDISAIGPVDDLNAGNGAEIVDLSHCTLLPALVDCSVSLVQSPSVDDRIRLSAEAAGHKEKEELLKKHLSYCDAYGVLGIAANDDISPFVQGYQKRDGGRHILDIRIPVKHGQGCLDDPASDGVNGDFLKIYSTSDIGIEEDSGRFSDGELSRMLKNRGGKKAVVVANGEQRVKEALEAGCDAIEQGYDMGLDNLRRMAEKNVLWIPGVLRAKNGIDGSSGGGDVCCRFSQRYVSPGKPVPGAEAFWKKMLAQQMTLLQEAKNVGVTVAIGTGAGSVGLLHGESMLEEMKLFMKAGYTLEETIRAGSENGARFFGMKGLGKLDVGRRATFLLTRGTVKQLPRKLSFLEGIYVDGFPSDTYRKNPEITVIG